MLVDNRERKMQSWKNVEKIRKLIYLHGDNDYEEDY
jgi:hypothetical protein